MTDYRLHPLAEPRVKLTLWLRGQEDGESESSGEESWRRSAMTVRAPTRRGFSGVGRKNEWIAEDRVGCGV